MELMDWTKIGAETVDLSLGGIVLHHHIEVVYADDRCYTEMLLDMAAA